MKMLATRRTRRKHAAREHFVERAIDCDEFNAANFADALLCRPRRERPTA
jgi:hypothetical protein